MRTSTFRRLGASLLLALFLPSCGDFPTLPGSPGALEPNSARGGAARGSDFPPEEGIPSLVEHRKVRDDLDVRLFASRDGKLRHMAARKDGRPAVHLRWHYRGDGSVERVSATIYRPDGRAREIPDVALPVGPPRASRAFLPGSAPAVSAAAYEPCWWEWIYLMDILLALLYAELEGNWALVGSLTVAAMKASLDLQMCLWKNGGNL